MVNGVIEGDAPLADALISAVSGNTSLLQIKKVAFPKTAPDSEYAVAPDDQLHYFKVATFISQFKSGSAYYFYDATKDDPKYRYMIDANVMPPSKGDRQIVINPVV